MTIYVPVPVEERLPEEQTVVLALTTVGPSAAYYFDDAWHCIGSYVPFTITHWLEERSLPSDQEIRTVAEGDPIANLAWESGFMEGANHIINLIKGKK